MGSSLCSGSAGRHVISFATQRTLVTAKDRILKPHIVKYTKIALKRRLVKFLEKRPIFIVGMKTYVQQSITFDPISIESSGFLQKYLHHIKC